MTGNGIRDWHNFRDFLYCVRFMFRDVEDSGDAFVESMLNEVIEMNGRAFTISEVREDE